MSGFDIFNIRYFLVHVYEKSAFILQELLIYGNPSSCLAKEQPHSEATSSVYIFLHHHINAFAYKKHPNIQINMKL